MSNNDRNFWKEQIHDRDHVLRLKLTCRNHRWNRYKKLKKRYLDKQFSNWHFHRRSIRHDLKNQKKTKFEISKRQLLKQVFQNSQLRMTFFNFLSIWKIIRIEIEVVKTFTMTKVKILKIFLIDIILTKTQIMSIEFWNCVWSCTISTIISSLIECEFWNWMNLC